MPQEFTIPHKLHSPSADRCIRPALAASIVSEYTLTVHWRFIRVMHLLHLSYNGRPIIHHSPPRHPFVMLLWSGQMMIASRISGYDCYPPKVVILCRRIVLCTPVWTLSAPQ